MIGVQRKLFGRCDEPVNSLQSGKYGVRYLLQSRIAVICILESIRQEGWRLPVILLVSNMYVVHWYSSKNKRTETVVRVCVDAQPIIRVAVRYSDLFGQRCLARVERKVIVGFVVEGV